MKQTICDACGSVIKNEPNQQSSIWGFQTTDMTASVSVIQDNLDICETCWKKIRLTKRGNEK